MLAKAARREPRPPRLSQAERPGSAPSPVPDGAGRKERPAAELRPKRRQRSLWSEKSTGRRQDRRQGRAERADRIPTPGEPEQTAGRSTFREPRGGSLSV